MPTLITPRPQHSPSDVIAFHPERDGTAGVYIVITRGHYFGCSRAYYITLFTCKHYKTSMFIPVWCGRTNAHTTVHEWSRHTFNPCHKAIRRLDGERVSCDRRETVTESQLKSIHPSGAETANPANPESRSLKCLLVLPNIIGVLLHGIWSVNLLVFRFVILWDNMIAKFIRFVRIFIGWCNSFDSPLH